MIAQVIINSNVKNLNKIFDYNVPSQMEGTICVGNRILVLRELIGNPGRPPRPRPTFNPQPRAPFGPGLRPPYMF